MIKVEVVTDFPDYSPGGKWTEIFDAVKSMPVGQVRRFTLDNQQEVRSAQASINSNSDHHVNPLKVMGYKVKTRTRPVNHEKTGAWHLFVKRVA